MPKIHDDRDDMTERERWAEDHGYYHWKCRVCGMSGWTDTSPDCACRCTVCGNVPEKCKCGDTR